MDKETKSKELNSVVHMDQRSSQKIPKKIKTFMKVQQIVARHRKLCELICVPSSKQIYVPSQIFQQFQVTVLYHGL